MKRKMQLESLLQQVIRHLLLFSIGQRKSERNYGHWQAEILGFRDQLKARLTTNLRNHLVEQRWKNLPKGIRICAKKNSVSD